MFLSEKQELPTVDSEAKSIGFQGISVTNTRQFALLGCMDRCCNICDDKWSFGSSDIKVIIYGRIIPH